MKFNNRISLFFAIAVIGISVILFFGCSPKTTYSKKSPSQSLKNKYKDQLDEGSKYVYSDYSTMLEKTEDGKYVHKQFYPDTRQITHYYTYNDRKMTQKNGYAKEYWDNGQVRFEGEYKNDQKVVNKCRLCNLKKWFGHILVF